MNQSRCRIRNHYTLNTVSCWLFSESNAVLSQPYLSAIPILSKFEPCSMYCDTCIHLYMYCDTCTVTHVHVYTCTHVYMCILLFTFAVPVQRQVFSALSQISKHSVDLAEMVVEAEVFPAILTSLKGVCNIITVLPM